MRLAAPGAVPERICFMSDYSFEQTCYSSSNLLTCESCGRRTSRLDRIPSAGGNGGAWVCCECGVLRGGSAESGAVPPSLRMK